MRISTKQNRNRTEKKLFAFIGILSILHLSPMFFFSFWQTVNFVDCRIFHLHSVTKTMTTQSGEFLEWLFIDGPIKIRLKTIWIDEYKEQIEYIHLAIIYGWLIIPCENWLCFLSMFGWLRTLHGVWEDGFGILSIAFASSSTLLWMEYKRRQKKRFNQKQPQQKQWNEVRRQLELF